MGIRYFNATLNGKKYIFMIFDMSNYMIYLFHQISVCPSCDLRCFIQGYTAKLNNK